VCKTKLKEYFEPIYKATDKDKYYPSQKNAGLFVTKLFIAGGSTYFRLPDGVVTANMVETQRKIYNGSFEFTPDQKNSFDPLDIEGLVAFFREYVRNDKIKELKNSFAVPDLSNGDTDLFFKALAYQFESFVKSPGQEAEGIVAMQYQHLVDHGDEPSETPIRTKYLSDSVMVSPNQVQRHQVSCHDKNVIHEWIIQNRGNRDWKGRRLFFKNHAEVKPRAVSNYVDIPDTPAGQYIKITTSIDARRHEGTTVCHWVMLDDQGEECFPDSKMFDFTLIAAFIYEPRKTEDLA